MISLTNFIFILYILIVIIGIIYSIHENIFSKEKWKIVKYFLFILIFIVMIMLTCLAMAKEETFSIVSTYDLIPINSMIIQEYKNAYIVFIKDNYIHSIVIPKENTEINFGNFPKLELKETFTKQSLILSAVEEKFINNRKEYILTIPNKSYIRIVNLR